MAMLSAEGWRKAVNKVLDKLKPVYGENPVPLDVFLFRLFRSRETAILDELDDLRVEKDQTKFQSHLLVFLEGISRILKRYPIPPEEKRYYPEELR